jgi:thiosulfate/3-mercaptopyruvate sulfurtransferase
MKMDKFNTGARSGIAWASALTLALTAMGMTGCQRKGAVAQDAGSAAVSDAPLAPSPGDPWSAGGLLEPADLARIISDRIGRKVPILYVGPAVLYRKAHILGAKAIGPAGQPQGLENLQREVQSLDRDSELVLYCGCCPFNVCPNVRPAFRKLQEMGFKRVKVLHIPNSFKQDWTNQGFPIQQ